MAKSLRSSEGFREFVLDQLQTLDVTSRSMFGGTGLYANDRFFAIIAMNALYLRVDDSNRAMFEREGMEPFRPFARRSVSMKYYQVPLGVLESAPELERWARLSIAVAEKAEAAKLPATTAARSAPRGKHARSARRRTGR